MEDTNFEGWKPIWTNGYGCGGSNRNDDRIRNDEVEEVKFLAHDNSMVIYLILLILTGIVLCLILLILNLNFNVLLLWKNHCRRKTDGDRKEYDVCIFYESKKNTATHSITAKDMALSHILPASH